MVRDEALIVVGGGVSDKIEKKKEVELTEKKRKEKKEVPQVPG